MSISIRCAQCRSDNKLIAKICRKCGQNFHGNASYRVRVLQSNGKWKSKLVNRLDLAKNIEAKFKTESIEQSVFNIRQSIKLSDAWMRYLAWAKNHKKTWKDDLARWEKHIASYVGEKYMDKVSPRHVHKILNKMEVSLTPKGTPYKPATIKQVLVLLKRVFNWAIKKELYSGDNPCVKVELPKFDNSVNNTLTRDGLQKLLTTLNQWENERAVLVIRFGLFSGRRRGEILSLKWEDIDLQNSLVTFRGINTKNGTTQTIPLNETCMQVIHRCREIQVSDYIFPSNTGNQYISFSNTWKRIRKSAGLSIRFHDLRHTFASYLASSGEVDIYTLKELLGHKSLAMTQRYAHLINGALRRGACVGDKVFGGL
ncbi:tyrosine-type recombinase/integrase [Thermodesulfobacteriota bacterium]